MSLLISTCRWIRMVQELWQCRQKLSLFVSSYWTQMAWGHCGLVLQEDRMMENSLRWACFHDLSACVFSVCANLTWCWDSRWCRRQWIWMHLSKPFKIVRIVEVVAVFVPAFIQWNLLRGKVHALTLRFISFLLNRRRTALLFSGQDLGRLGWGSVWLDGWWIKGAYTNSPAKRKLKFCDDLTSIFCLNWWQIFDQFFNGPKKLTSSGWATCVVWGGGKTYFFISQFNCFQCVVTGVTIHQEEYRPSWWNVTEEWRKCMDEHLGARPV